jgi:hypothetical protein
MMFFTGLLTAPTQMQAQPPIQLGTASVAMPRISKGSLSWNKWWLSESPNAMAFINSELACFTEHFSS